MTYSQGYVLMEEYRASRKNPILEVLILTVDSYLATRIFCIGE